MRICIAGDLTIHLRFKSSGRRGIKGFVCETGVRERMSCVLSRRMIEK
jgi:hypothetical protein